MREGGGRFLFSLAQNLDEASFYMVGALKSNEAGNFRVFFI